MATTKIEWTATVNQDGSITKGASWNFVTGCDKISAGCKNCYAEAIADRMWAKQYPPNPDGSPRRFTDVRLHRERLDQPLHWRKPRRIFVNSMSDLFHEDVPDWFIFAAWRIMHKTSHTYQVLTKRPERMLAWLEKMSDTGGSIEPVMWRKGQHTSWVTDEEAQRVIHSGRGQMFHDWVASLGEPPEGYAAPVFDWAEGERWWATVPNNLWLGVSVEDQANADKRIPLLLQAPGATRFLSCEPLLGPIQLADVCNDWLEDGISWVIVGGESGPGARACNIEWIRYIRDQCRDAQVPVFIKQLGARPVELGHGKLDSAKIAVQLRDPKGGNMEEWPEDLRIREYPALDPLQAGLPI